MTLQYVPAVVARQFRFVREAAEPNTGQRVEAIQRWCGGVPGDSWCAYFATMVLDICFQGNAPIPRGGSCQAIYAQAKANGWLTDLPAINDLFLYVTDDGVAHHVGIVTRVGDDKRTFLGIAGNTSESGTSSNGTGVFEHWINARVFVHYPRE